MIAYCPICHSPSRLPTENSEQSLRFECPACLSLVEFAVSSDSADPFRVGNFRLLRVEVPTGSSSSFEAESFLEQPTGGFAAESGLFDLDLDANTENSGFSDTTQPQQPNWSPDMASRHVQVDLEGSRSIKARRRPPKKSSLGSFIQVVFGGLASVPIATAIMWFGMGRDPFGWAPLVAEHAPWAVPESLRGHQATIPRIAREQRQAERPISELPEIQPPSIPPEQSAQKTAPEFELTPDNSADVVEASFTNWEVALNNAVEDPNADAITKFHQACDELISLIPRQHQGLLNISLKLDAVGDKLVDLKPILKTTIISGIQRSATDQVDSVGSLIDVIELQEVQTLAPDNMLAQRLLEYSSDDFVELIPSQATPARVRAMRVVVRDDSPVVQSFDGKAEQLVLIGRFIESESKDHSKSNERIFEVLASSSLRQK